MTVCARGEAARFSGTVSGNQQRRGVRGVTQPAACARTRSTVLYCVWSVDSDRARCAASTLYAARRLMVPSFRHEKMGLAGRKSNRINVITDGDATEHEEHVIEAAKTAYKGAAFMEAEVTFMKAMWLFITMQWLGLGDKVTTQETGTTIKDNFVNVGVVAALLFTMIALDSGSVGEELTTLSNGTLTVEACGMAFAFLNSLALWCLFGAVIHSLYLYCQVSELYTAAEVHYWSRNMGIFLINFHFLYLIFGFLLYIVAQAFLALTILGLTLWLISMAILIIFVAIPLMLASIWSVQAMYNAKRDVLKPDTSAKQDNGSVSA